MINWKAVYNDGNSLPQYNEDNSENKYPNIDRTKLQFFEIWDDNKLVLRLHLSHGRRLIYRRRVGIHPNNKLAYIVYLVGWQKTIKGVNEQDIAYIFEDGHIELAGSWDNSNVLFSKVNLREEEKGL